MARLLADCLSAAGGREMSCIGLFADSCLEHADSTERMADCEARERAVWDGWMRRDNSAAMIRLAAPARSELRAIQRAFAIETARRCRFVVRVNGPTAINAPHEQECRLRATAIQWLWLRDFASSP